MSGILEPGPDWTLNACVPSGRLCPWGTYARGYRKAAELLTQHVVELRRFRDELIFPVIFLWRHYAELKLKAVIRLAARAAEQKVPDTKGHGLQSLWSQASKLAKAAYENVNAKPRAPSMSRIAQRLANLEAIDKGSIVFRYPESNDGSSSLLGVTHINYETVDSEMQKLAELLDGLEFDLDQIIEFLPDMKFYAGADEETYP